MNDICPFLSSNKILKHHFQFDAFFKFPALKYTKSHFFLYLSCRGFWLGLYTCTLDIVFLRTENNSKNIIRRIF